MSVLTTDHKPSDDQLDEIGRRIEDVIGEQDGAVIEHMRPHWEVVYDAGHAYAARIVHLHGEHGETATVSASGDGESRATCCDCGATLQISRARPSGVDRRAVAPIG